MPEVGDKPAITAPVARSIGVVDVARSAAFYRDVLGFEIRVQDGVTEARYGPARLQFQQEHPAKLRTLFFEAGDVAAMHAFIRSRGGEPSEPDKVNWIKMHVFEMRDPDGHMLWFGRSFNVPDPYHLSPMMQKTLPEMPFDNVAAAVDYYRDVLGFEINYQQDDLGVMDRGEITILLIQRTECHKGIGSFEVYIEDADALYAELKSKGANVQSEPESRPWGLRDFRILDLEGNRITFAQTFE